LFGSSALQEGTAMSEAARRKMTADEFYVWVRTQTEGRYELVDGEPVMMAGATNHAAKSLTFAAGPISPSPCGRGPGEGSKQGPFV
jgi:hypothetical protein